MGRNVGAGGSECEHVCAEGLRESPAHHRRRGYALKMGDAGLGVLAVGVASRIRYGSRHLLFNCAMPGYRARPDDLLHTIGPALVQMFNMADHQIGVR